MSTRLSTNRNRETLLNISDRDNKRSAKRARKVAPDEITVRFRQEDNDFPDDDSTFGAFVVLDEDAKFYRAACEWVQPDSGTTLFSLQFEIDGELVGDQFDESIVEDSLDEFGDKFFGTSIIVRRGTRLRLHVNTSQDIEEFEARLIGNRI